MASGSLPMGIDFNDKANLDLYFKIRQFKDDLSLDSLFLDHSKEDRLKIHTIAESFNLEYEYSAKTGYLILSRVPESIEAEKSAREPIDNFIDENLPDWDPSHYDFGQKFGDFVGFNTWMASGGVDGEAAEAQATTSSQNILEDLALPPFYQDQSTNALLERGALAHDIRLQEIDEPLSASYPITQNNHGPTAAVSEALTVEETKSQEQSGQFVGSQLTPHKCDVDTRKDLYFQSPASLLRRGFEAHTIYESEDGSEDSYSQFYWSESAHSDASVPSVVSGRSCRTGPLSDWARAGMNAVKRVGACWRCIFLRKKCDPDSPCLICPKGGKSSWEALGCHRGDFKTRMLPIRICPAEFSQNIDEVQALSEDNSSHTENPARKLWVDIDPTDSDVDADDESLCRQKIRTLFLKEIEDKCKLLPQPPDPAVLQPLQYCTMCIVWEILQTPDSLTLLDGGGILDTLLRILPAAVVYQANLESDQLIAQSLICLRSCLEVLRFDLDVLDTENHTLCCKSRCRYSCIRELRMNIMLYLDELSRVFFRKKNLRNKGPSWLSTFYSFCIQSLVRTSLIEIMDGYATTGLQGTDIAVNQYLYLPLRLFIATHPGSSTKDPLVADEVLGIGLPSLEEYESVRIAVNHADWKLMGINNWGEYLKRLVQDEGAILEFSQAKIQTEADTVADNEQELVTTVRRKLNLLKCQ